jgi:hypothetical protein
MLQFTVREMVAVCCRDPEVAVTVTVEVTGVVPLPPPPPLPPPEPEPPLQLISRESPSPLTANKTSIRSCRRLPRLKKSKAPTSTVSGNSGRFLLARTGVVEDVANVRVVEAVEPDGVTVAGEKPHDAPEGSPEQANETAELKPFAGVTEIDAVPLCPGVTVNDAGEAVTEKS